MVKPISQIWIKRSPLRQKKVSLSDRWSFKIGSIHIQISMTGKESVIFKYEWLLSRGDRIDMFDCIHIKWRTFCIWKITSSVVCFLVDNSASEIYNLYTPSKISNIICENNSPPGVASRSFYHHKSKHYCDWKTEQQQKRCSFALICVQI